MQVFSSKAWKKIGADPSCRFRENAKNALFNSEKRRHEPKARRLDYSNNQFGADPSCCFWENARNTHFYYEKLRHQAEV